MTEPPSDDRPGDSIPPGELNERLAASEKLTVVDVRDRDEFEAWHVDGPGVRALQVPHVRFLQAEARGSVDDLVDEHALDGPVVVVCARGEASGHVAALLRDAGVRAANLEGGMDAWARTYVSRELAPGRVDTGGLTVRQYVRPSSGCLAYLVTDGKRAAVVDPLRAFADRYADDAADRGLEIVAVVDTHVHADHLSGLREVAAATGATAYLPEGAIDRGLAFDATLLADGDAVPLGGAGLSAVHLPGHTTEMTALEAGGLLLAGDSLFVESVARPDLEAGDEGAQALAERLHVSLQERVLSRTDDTVVAPGHVGPHTVPAEDGTYTARLGVLRGRLDLLELDREAFVGRVVDDMPPRPANYETIVAANLGRVDLGSEEAFELELGPNNCAVSA